MADREVLKKQLELVRFEKAIDYITINAGGQKHLNSQELARINNLMTGSDDSPWRQEPTVISLPSGRKESLSLISNPLFQVRDVLSEAWQEAREGDVEEAASSLYSQLVLSHFFKDANRRTAVAATYWLLLENGIKIPAIGLLELGLGDIRVKEQHEALKNLLRLTIKIAKSRKS